MIRELFRKIFHREERVDTDSSVLSGFKPLNPLKPIEEDIKNFSISILNGNSRVVDTIVIHSSKTRANDITNIDNAESFFKERGYKKNVYTGKYIPYHYLIYKDGEICKFTPLNAPSCSNEDKAQNNVSICYIGGIGKDLKRTDTRTERQKASIRWLITELSNKLSISNIIWFETKYEEENGI